jgi:hypothetical protein
MAALLHMADVQQGRSLEAESTLPETHRKALELSTCVSLRHSGRECEIQAQISQKVHRGS